MSPLLSFDGHRIAKHPYHVSPIVQDRQAVSSQLEFVTTLISSQDDSSDVSDLENSTKRTVTSVLSRKEWTHKRWNGMAQPIQMKRYLVLTYLAG